MGVVLPAVHPALGQAGELIVRGRHGGRCHCRTRVGPGTLREAGVGVGVGLVLALAEGVVRGMRGLRATRTCGDCNEIAVLVGVMFGVHGLLVCFGFVGGVLVGIGGFVFKDFDEFVEAGGDNGSEDRTEPVDCCPTLAGYSREVR